MNRASVFFNLSYHPNPGAIGCHLSHIKAFHHLLLSDEEAIIILEDDAEVTDDFAHHMSCLADAVATLDIIFLCDRRADRPSELIGTSAKGLEFGFKRFTNFGTNGYVINRKAAAFMIAQHAKFGLEIDMLLNKWWRTGLHVATTGRDLVSHDDMGSSIGYDNIKPVKNPMRRLAVSANRGISSLTKRLAYQTHYRRMKTAFEKVYTS